MRRVATQPRRTARTLPFLVHLAMSNVPRRHELGAVSHTHRARSIRLAAGDFTDRPVARLRSYLEQLKQSGESLPTCCGRPNKSVIARNAGVDRDLFHRSIEAATMLETFVNLNRRR